jgi:DNA primase
VFVDQFVQWANDQLEHSEIAQEYFRGRGISKEQWARHRLGFVGGDFDVDPNSYPGHSDTCSDFEKKRLWCDACHYRSWSSVWEAPEEGARKVQHVGRRIAGSIVFPLTSYSGQTVGFQIRSLERKEYDTFVLKRRPEGYFFGIGPNMESIWASREICLVEGPPDQLVVERLVRPDVVALTTAGAGTFQMRFLRRFVKKIYLCLDRDKAGRDGTQSLIKQCSQDFELVDVNYSHSKGGKDCNDIWKKIGDDAFRTHMTRAIFA